MQHRTSLAPLGWTFNPSKRTHRLRLLPFACTGFLIVLYLALCQMGVFHSAWDPLFVDGTDKVLHSRISQAIPIPDALLGAGFYLIEILLLLIGPNDRWLRNPCLTLLSGLTGIALGLASIALMFLQPVVVHAWCTWCLISLILVLLLLQRSFCEFLACIQTGIFVSQYGWSVKRWLLKGPDEQTSLLLSSQLDQETSFPWTAGTGCVWTLFVSFLLGSITLALPDLSGIEGVGKGTVEFCGAVTLAVSLISMSEPLRFLRYVNGAMGTLLFFWFLGQPSGAERWIAAALGMAIMGLCIHRGKITETYGLFSSPSETQYQIDRKLSVFQSEVLD